MSEIEVPEGWELKKLSEIGEIVTGSTPNTSKLEFYGTDCPFYKPADLDQGEEISSAKNGLSEKGLKAGRFLPKNSILVNCIGTIGKSSIIKKSGCSNQQINAIIPDEKIILPKFVFYWIKTPYIQNLMKQNATRTTLPILNKSKFKILPIIIPSLQIQKRIIEKLDNTLKKLEYTHRTILNHDFLVNNQILKNNLKNSLLQTIRNGFYQKNEWNSFRKEKLGVLTTVTAGGTPSRGNFNYWNGDVPWIKSGELKDDTTSDSKEYITKEGLKNSSAKLFPKDTILIALYGQGKTRGKTTLLLKEASSNQACCAILPIPVLNPVYLQLWLRSMYDELRKKTRTGPQPNWNAQMIKEIEITVPPIEIQNKIVSEITKKFKLINELDSLIDTLIENKTRMLSNFVNMKNQVLNGAFNKQFV